jgi:AraC family transcriptional regulator
MLFQLMPHEADAANAWEGETSDNAEELEGASLVIRFAIEKIPVSIIVADRRGRDAGSMADLFVVKRSGAGDGAAGERLDVHVVSAPLYECLEGIRGLVGPDEVVIADPRFGRDPIIKRLARALVAMEAVGHGLGPVYANAVCVAIVTRLIAIRRTSGPPAAPGTRRKALAKWRLKKVVEYVDTYLSHCITLADLAATAGLTRMHFAAQFRMATGLRPHEYVLRRRIERAQELLRSSNLALIEVALDVGFQTQAHFTTVFKRFTGETPHQWRRAIADSLALVPM